MVTALAALAEDRDSFGLQHPHGGSHALVTPALEDICHPFLASTFINFDGLYVCMRRRVHMSYMDVYV